MKSWENIENFSGKDIGLSYVPNLRQYCRDDSAFDELQQILLSAEVERHRLQAHLKTIQHQQQTQFDQLRFQASLLNQVCNAIIATDLQGCITHWNFYAEKLYQWQAEEVLGKEILAVLEPMQDQANGQAIARQMVSQVFKAELWEGELIVHRKDGSQFWAEVKNTLLRDDRDRPIGFVGISVDISDRKQAQAALAQQAAILHSQAKYRSIFENATEGIFQTSLDGHYLSANHALASLYGYTSPEELIAHLTTIEQQLYVDPNRRAAFLEIMQQHGSVSEFESQVYRRDSPKDGFADRSIIWVSENAHCVYGETGEILYYEGTVSDITQRKHAEQQLQQQADRDRLLGAIALQIRQSLDLEEILHRTVDEVRQFLQTDRVLVYRFDAQHGVLVAASVDPDWSLSKQHDAHQSWHQDNHALDEQGQLYVMHDVTQQNLSPDYLVFMQQIQVQAKLVVPLSQGEQIWGVLAVHHCRAIREWQAFEIDLVQNLAVQVAIAIQQAQLFSQLQHQAQREQVLNQLGQAVNSNLDPDNILQEIVDRTGESFGVDRVLILTINDTICARKEWCADPTIPSLIDQAFPVEDWTDLADPNSEFNQGRTFYAFDMTQLLTTPGRQTHINDGQTLSVLCAPIFIREKLFGALSLHTTTCYRTFTPEEVQFLQRISDQTAIALYNAQSYECLEQLVKQRTQELEQEKRVSEAANRAKTDFLATMSHELRTPLNAVLGLSQVLKREIFGSLSAKQLEYINHIHSSGEHLLMLINDILDLAKVEAGRETLMPTVLAAHDLCHYCLAMVREQATLQGLQLVSQLDANAKFCTADERRLKQMLLNLLSNAVKFTSAGTVSLIVCKQPQGISFTIADTGIGIPADKLDLLFQPFSQLDGELTRSYAGTGLGLALTRKLARLHGGDVTVSSVPGVGSEFTLFLPDVLIESPPRSQALALNPYVVQHQQSTGKILLVENDVISATLLQDYLKAIGYQVETLCNGDDFLTRVRDFCPNLILMDVQLSQTLSRLELLKQLRSEPDLQDLPVILVTAMAMAGDRENFLTHGATDYLSKPLDIVRLELLLIKYL
ncbi:GAF domain-containing protein [Phormidium sp. CLA17]|uniref:GAF domain-containing protein n=1 Tax=Leptolyngbya sp. Cla-17 TaxID=2803751 RepID=UPI001491FE12|nr:GAF domain-containing protein [Leptolyngbya sp. Cla-17]MBM0742000.1 GAF domain-containing protein [Leptolyngbya sp. Cla-17]